MLLGDPISRGTDSSESPPPFRRAAACRPELAPPKRSRWAVCLRLCGTRRVSSRPYSGSRHRRARTLRRCRAAGRISRTESPWNGWRCRLGPMRTGPQNATPALWKPRRVAQGAYGLSANCTGASCSPSAMPAHRHRSRPTVKRSKETQAREWRLEINRFLSYDGLSKQPGEPTRSHMGSRRTCG